MGNNLKPSVPWEEVKTRLEETIFNGNKFKLIKPTTKLKNEYLKMFDEFAMSGDTTILGEAPSEFANFSEFTKTINNYSKGINLKKGFVKYSTYWLVNEERTRIFGTVNIRHELNKSLRKRGGHIGYLIRPSERGHGYAKKLLSLSLKLTDELRIKKVLLTCDKENYASSKTIIALGGVLNSEEIYEGIIIQRYYIRREIRKKIKISKELRDMVERLQELKEMVKKERKKKDNVKY